MTRRKAPVSAEEFARIWNGAASVAEVVRRTGSTKSAVQTRAGDYRRRGIALKRFPRGRKALDVPALRRIARAARRPS